MPGSALKIARLRPGDAIGVAAPASCFDQALFQKGLEILSGLGHPVKVHPGIFERLDFWAGDDRRRAGVFMDLWADPEVKAVMCARGGYGSMRILPWLDYGKMASGPKILVGFSDISALLCTVAARCHAPVLHGPVITSLAGAPDDARALALALEGEGPVLLRAGHPHVLASGKARGRVMGGNLTTLCHLAGTPFAPSLEGCILFLEDVGEAPYRIDRMLFHMQSAGMLEGVRGVALGAFTDCGDAEAVHRVISQCFQPRAVPVLAGFPAGHGPVNQTFPLGAPAVLDTEKGTLEFLEMAPGHG